MARQFEKLDKKTHLWLESPANVSLNKVNPLPGKWLYMSTRINCLVRKDLELIDLSNHYLPIFKFENLENLKISKFSQTFVVSKKNVIYEKE